MIDPYPTELLDELPQTVPDPLVNALTRLAQAIEQNTAALRSQPVQNGPGRPQLAPLPPVATQAPQLDGCPIHNAPWKTVPAGVSKKTGKPYDAFRACSIAGCDQRPRL